MARLRKTSQPPVDRSAAASENPSRVWAVALSLLAVVLLALGAMSIHRVVIRGQEWSLSQPQLNAAVTQNQVQRLQVAATTPSTAPAGEPETTGQADCPT